MIADHGLYSPRMGTQSSTHADHHKGRQWIPAALCSDPSSGTHQLESHRVVSVLQRYSVVMAAASPNEVILGTKRYSLVKKLGTGGQGHVWLADPNQAGVPLVAIKCNPGRLGEPAADPGHRLEQECRLGHCDGLDGLVPKSISQFEQFERDGQPHVGFVREYIAGLPILEHVNALSLSVRKRLELFRDVCRTVHKACVQMGGVIHRDLKPDNIVIEQSSNCPYIIDWGMAKSALPAANEMMNSGQDVNTVVGDLGGTGPYVPPESRGQGQHAEGIRTAGKLSSASPEWDGYSLGISLYQLLVGRVPVDGSLDGKGWRVLHGQQCHPLLRDALLSRHAGQTGLVVSTPDCSNADALRQQLDEDLEILVLRTWHWDRDKREYKTPATIAQAIDEYLRRPSFETTLRHASENSSGHTGESIFTGLRSLRPRSDQVHSSYDYAATIHMARKELEEGHHEGARRALRHASDARATVGWEQEHLQAVLNSSILTIRGEAEGAAISANGEVVASHGKASKPLGRLELLGRSASTLVQVVGGTAAPVEIPAGSIPRKECDLSLSACGRYLARIRRDFAVRLHLGKVQSAGEIWDTHNTAQPLHQWDTYPATFNPDDDEYRNLSSSREAPARRFDGFVWASTKRRAAIIHGSDVHVWDAHRTGDPILIPLCGHIKQVTSVAWSPEGDRLVSASCDDTYQIWQSTDAGKWSTVRTINAGFTGAGSWGACRFSADGTRVVVTHIGGGGSRDDRSLKSGGIWCATEGADLVDRLWQTEPGVGRESKLLPIGAYSPAGNAVLLLWHNHTPCVAALDSYNNWATTQLNQCHIAFRDMEEDSLRAQFSRNGRWIALRFEVKGRGRRVELWDARSGQWMRELSEYQEIDFHPGLDLALARRPDRSTVRVPPRLIDLNQRTTIWRLPRHLNPWTCASHAGRCILGNELFDLSLLPSTVMGRERGHEEGGGVTRDHEKGEITWEGYWNSVQHAHALAEFNDASSLPTRHVVAVNTAQRLSVWDVRSSVLRSDFRGTPNSSENTDIARGGDDPATGEPFVVTPAGWEDLRIIQVKLSSDCTRFIAIDCKTVRHSRSDQEAGPDMESGSILRQEWMKWRFHIADGGRGEVVQAGDVPRSTLWTGAVAENFAFLLAKRDCLILQHTEGYELFRIPGVSVGRRDAILIAETSQGPLLIVRASTDEAERSSAALHLHAWDLASRQEITLPPAVTDFGFAPRCLTAHREVDQRDQQISWKHVWLKSVSPERKWLILGVQTSVHASEKWHFALVPFAASSTNGSSLLGDDKRNPLWNNGGRILESGYFDSEDIDAVRTLSSAFDEVIQSLSFSKDESLVAWIETFAFPARVVVADQAAEDWCRINLEGRQHPRCIAMHPTQPRIAIGLERDGAAASICIADTSIGGEGMVLLKLKGHCDNVTGLRWIDGGMTLMSWSDDGTVRLWHAATASERLQADNRQSDPATKQTVLMAARGRVIRRGGNPDDVSSLLVEAELDPLWRYRFRS